MMNNINIKSIYQIVKDFKIEKEFLYVLKYNKSNFLPYHGLGHTLSVFDAVYNISKEYFTGIEAYDVQCMLIAALFHDVGHSGGLYEDNVNVEIAISHMTKMKYEKKKEEFIKKLIYATKYPYIENYITYVENYIMSTDFDYVSIMRDADLVQSARPDFIQYVIGLGNEFKMNMDNLSSLLTNTIDFNTNNEFILNETRRLYQTGRDSNIALLKDIVEYENSSNR